MQRLQLCCEKFGDYLILLSFLMFTLEVFMHNVNWFLLILNLGNKLTYLGIFVISLYCYKFKSVFPEPYEKSNFPKLEI